MNTKRGCDVKCNSKIEREKDPEQSQSENERERETETDTGMVVGVVVVVSWSADRSPEVVIYSSVSISQQQLQPSFFISFHSLRTERHFCPSEPNRH